MHRVRELRILHGYHPIQRLRRHGCHRLCLGSSNYSRFLNNRYSSKKMWKPHRIPLKLILYCHYQGNYFGVVLKGHPEHVFSSRDLKEKTLNMDYTDHLSPRWGRSIWSGRRLTYHSYHPNRIHNQIHVYFSGYFQKNPSILTALGLIPQTRTFRKPSMNHMNPGF